MKRAFQLAAVGLLVVLSLGLVEAQFHLFGRLFRDLPLGQRELATQFLGQYLAGQFPGKRAIVLSNPFSAKPGQPREVYEFEKAGLRGLRRGLGTAVKLEAVVYPDLRPEFFTNRQAVLIDRSTKTPLSYLMTADALDKVVSQHPDAELVVSLIGLPVNVRETEAWKSASGRRFALLLPDLRMVGNQAAILQAVQSRKIAAFVLNKPGAPPEDQPLGRDLRMEFDQRFLLINPETVDRYLKAFPRLF